MRLPRIFFVVGLLLTSSCFPVATPPVVYHLDPSTGEGSNCAPVVLLTSQRAAQDFLGIQFVLGVIPLTRMYTSESITAMAERELEEVLRQQGFCVIRAPVASRDTLVADAVAPLIFEVLGAENSASVYDLLVVRRISTQGVVQVSVAQAPQYHSIPQRVEFAAGEFAKTGYSLQVLRLLRSALGEALRERVTPAFYQRQRRAYQASSTERYVQIAPPRIASLPLSTYASLEGDFATGLDANRWPQELQFRLQQGISTALLSDSTQPRVLWSSRTCCRPSAGWQVQSELREIALVDRGGAMSMVLRLGLMRNRSLVRRSECRVTIPLTGQSRDLPLLGIASIAEKLTKEFYTSTGGQRLPDSTTNPTTGKDLQCSDV